jgi:hypothetical protein
MINFIQLHQNITDWESNIITDDIWLSIYTTLTQDKDAVVSLIHQISVQYNLDKKNIMKQYFHYIIRNRPQDVSPEFLNTVEVIMHSNDSNMTHLLQYFCEQLASQMKKEN